MPNGGRVPHRKVGWRGAAVAVLLVGLLVACEGSDGSEGGGPTSTSARAHHALSPGAGSDDALYAPLGDTSTYLVDSSNDVVHTWTSDYKPGQSAYLQDDGSIVRAGFVADPANRFVMQSNEGLPTGNFNTGGIVERIGSDDDVSWSFTYYSDTYMPHHDVEVLPNGNILMILWQYKTEEAALAAGRRPGLVTDQGVWPDSIIEVRPRGTTGGDIVWQWNSWDHVVQDADPSKENYGDVGDHPELVDLNYWTQTNPDIMHTDSVTYLEQDDEIVLSVHDYSELWVIDHSTTTEEAASHRGGRRGKGGDLLYRWGNRAAYGQEVSGVYTLNGVHDANGYTEDGTLLMFDNHFSFLRAVGATGDSTLVEIRPPVDADGSYPMRDGTWGPDQPLWTAQLPFNEPVTGTAERLPDGSTFSCDCIEGVVVLVDAEGAVVSSRTLSDADGVGMGGGAFRIPGYSSTFAGVEALR